jgi:hypothetical protein
VKVTLLHLRKGAPDYFSEVLIDVNLSLIERADVRDVGPSDIRRLYRFAPKMLGALAIVKPETVINWHRAGFRSYWRWKSLRQCLFTGVDRKSPVLGQTGANDPNRPSLLHAGLRVALLEDAQSALGGMGTL